MSWALLLAGTVAGCATVSAKYPSWEPTPSTVPAVSDRKLALADLEVSRQLWLGRAWRDYSYVRARQTSPEDVEFTLIVVRDRSVVERSLFTSETDASGLGDRLSGKFGRAPRLLWRERGREIGRHDVAAPALTADELYDLCRDRVLSVRGAPSPRLSFHRDGLLQHCGFLSQDCDDCATVSVQALSYATPQPWQAPSDLLCTDRYGLFLPGQAPLTSVGCEVCSCEANKPSDPNASPNEQGIGDICKIDPAACPKGELLADRGNWFCKHLLSGDGCGGTFARDLPPECMALPRPTSWSEPAWQRHCRPRP
jgi:hypothetical protein